MKRRIKMKRTRYHHHHHHHHHRSRLLPSIAPATRSSPISRPWTCSTSGTRLWRAPSRRSCSSAGWTSMCCWCRAERLICRCSGTAGPGGRWGPRWALTSSAWVGMCGNNNSTSTTNWETCKSVKLHRHLGKVQGVCLEAMMEAVWVTQAELWDLDTSDLFSWWRQSLVFFFVEFRDSERVKGLVKTKVRSSHMKVISAGNGLNNGGSRLTLVTVQPAHSLDIMSPAVGLTLDLYETITTILLDIYKQYLSLRDAQIKPFLLQYLKSKYQYGL